MSDNKYRTIRYKQNTTEYLNAVLPFGVINQLSYVLEYGVNPHGYQRKPNRIHLLKVKSYIKENEDFKFPSSIILGVDKSSLNEKILKKDNCGEYLEFDFKSNKEIFRIVDGQHRIFGIREALKENPSLSELLLPVTIIISPENKKSIELEIFTQINSKAKRISTDLAELAKYNYEIIENNVTEKSIINHISIKTAYLLKNSGNDNVWNQGIKFDIHSDIILGIVGVTMFCESIKNIVEGYANKEEYTTLINSNRKEKVIEYCDKIATVITEDLNFVWNVIVKSKWPQCFKQITVKDENGELFDIYYTKDFYLQNTLGVKAINNIFGDLIKANKKSKKNLDLFEEIIRDSQVTHKHWQKGGLFSGLSSEAGFKKVREIIKNEISIK